jgi:hypothetical protein
MIAETRKRRKEGKKEKIKVRRRTGVKGKTGTRIGSRDTLPHTSPQMSPLSSSRKWVYQKPLKRFAGDVPG